MAKRFELQKTTFGELVAGDIFCLSASHPSYGLKYMNVKMGGFAVFRGKDGKTITPENEEHPFNVVALGDGRPRDFHDNSAVYKVTFS